MKTPSQFTSRLEASHVPSKALEKELVVLRIVHRKKDVSRVELTELTGLSAGSITATVQALLEKNLVIEIQGRSSVAGRRPVALRVRHDAAYVIGVDIGSFYVRVVVSDMLGNVLQSRTAETNLPEGRRNVLSKTFHVIHDAISASGVPNQRIRAMGVGHSGIIDTQTGTVLSFPRPGQMTEWKNVPLGKMMEDEFHVPCVLEDSVRAIAFAEKCVGAGKDLEDFVYIDVGMGIGAAIIFNGNLYRGYGGAQANSGT